jgi:hypothetical protein
MIFGVAANAAAVERLRVRKRMRNCFADIGLSPFQPADYTSGWKNGIGIVNEADSVHIERFCRRSG